ncbi:MAG: sporulation protein [Actinotalea sp.]|nr:sporulation protein [Actinotalea sp.]
MKTFDPSAVADLLTPRKAFGEPIVQDGVTLVPVARVTGLSGGGGGQGPTPHGAESQGDGAGEASGSGGGLAVQVRPLGVYVVEGPVVTWRPALDVQRIVLGGQAVGALAILTVLVAVLRRRR